VSNLWTWILSQPVNKPPKYRQHNDPHQDHAGPVHEGDWLYWIGVREAEEDVEEDDQRAGNAVDDESELAHPEWTWRYILTSGEQMREERQEVAHSSKYYEAPDCTSISKDLK